MKETLISIKEYAVKNILRFLLLAVILTLCFAMRFAAMGKYVTYMQEETQAVAGESFFASNWLKAFDEGEENLAGLANYSISAWDKKEYTLSVDLQNYNNIYKYNKDENQNIFVYVDLDLLDSAGDPYYDTLKAKYENLTLDVTYERSGTETYDGTYTTGSKTYKVILISGGQPNLVKANISLKADNTHGSETKITENFYIKAVAKMVPLSEYYKINLTKSDELYTEAKNNSEGIFYEQLGGCFYMGAVQTSADINYNVTHTEGLYPVTATATCDMNNQSSVKMRCYFNSSRIEMTTDQSYVVTAVTSSTADERAEVLEDTDLTAAEIALLDRYIEETLYPGTPAIISFLKIHPDVFDADKDIAFGVKTDAE